MKTWIAVETTRYSTLLKRILTEYNEDVIIKIAIGTYSPRARRIYRDKDIPGLIASWCTNRNIKQTTFFSLEQASNQLFGFWDHPDNLWADISVLPFVEALAKEKVVRFHIVRPRASTTASCFKRRFAKTEPRAPAD